MAGLFIVVLCQPDVVNFTRLSATNIGQWFCYKYP